MENEPKVAIDVALEEIEALLSAEASIEKRIADVQDESWIPIFYLKMLHNNNAKRAKLKEQCAIRLAQLDTELTSLARTWMVPCCREVEKQLKDQHGERKSIDTEYGKAGFRTVSKSQRIDILDEDKAVSILEYTCPDAVKKSIRKTELKKHLVATGEEIDGTKVVTTPARDIFFIGSQKFEEQE